jgi:putative hydrolase of HD superfamily
MKQADNLANKILELQKFLYELVKIERMIFFPTNIREERPENDVEHSYNLAMLAWYVCCQLPGLDKNRVIQYALVNDIVEVHAGDIMAIGRTQEEQLSKEKREQEAVKKIDQSWGKDFPDMTQTIRSYESQQDDEAIFVKALDKLAPMIHNVIGEGNTWKKWNMEMDAVLKNKDEKTAPSIEVAAIWQSFRTEILKHPEWFNKK